MGVSEQVNVGVSGCKVFVVIYGDLTISYDRHFVSGIRDLIDIYFLLFLRGLYRDFY